MYRAFTFTPEDIRLAQGPRDHWTRATVDYFLEKYGEREIKKVDAINRRFGHVLNNSIQYMFVIPFVVPNQTDRVVALLVHCVLSCTLKTSMVSMGGAVASAVFQGSRIRDGRLGRLNLVVVKYIGIASIPLLLLLFLNSDVLPQHIPYFVVYAFQGKVWGDTMAELIGSFFGRIEFHVRGFGEINRKTVEGCVACWVASFFGCWYISSFTAFPSASFSIPVIWLNVLSASGSTFAETVSFRGTDNGTMLLVVGFILLHFYERPAGPNAAADVLRMGVESSPSAFLGRLG
jgi:CDP-diglyceride synthetase